MINYLSLGKQPQKFTQQRAWMVSTNLWFLCGDVKFHTLWWSLLALRELLKPYTQMLFPNHGLNVQRENSSSLPLLLVTLLEVHKVHIYYEKATKFWKNSELFLNWRLLQVISNKRLGDLFKVFWHKISNKNEGTSLHDCKLTNWQFAI